MWRNLIDSNNIISNNGKKRHSYFLTMNLYTQKKKKKKIQFDCWKRPVFWASGYLKTVGFGFVFNVSSANTAPLLETVFYLNTF